MPNKNMPKSLTLVIPAGRMQMAAFDTIGELAKRYGLGIYLTTMQNIRLLDVPVDQEEVIWNELALAGILVKKPGLFPKPKVCVGSRYCKLGQVDTFDLSEEIMARFGSREGMKPKIKIAISGCPACCSDAVLKDIGIRATKGGFEVFAGGKGGPMPKAGRRIAVRASEAEVLDMMAALIDFHDRRTGQKQRMAKLLNDPEFPYDEV